MQKPNRMLGASLVLLLLLILALYRRSTNPAPPSTQAPRPERAHSATAEADHSKRRSQPPKRSPPAGTQSLANPYFVLADEMAPGSRYARSGLTNLLLMLSLSDAFATEPDLTDEQLLVQLSGNGFNPESISERLASYPRGQSTTAELYARNASIPGFKEVRAALVASGLEIDPNSECLLECLRLVACKSELGGFLQELQDSMSTGPGKDIYARLVTTLARDGEDLRWAFDRVYRDRLLLRYGLPEPQVDQLLKSLAGLNVPQATTRDLYLPRRRRE